MDKDKNRRRHYVIVVHGIGEQKLNETTTEVVHRFAEVRRGETAGSYGNLLPSYLSAQSVRRSGMGHGWSEFNGIPVNPKDDTGNFDGTPATATSGLNFRFVDLHWAHILRRHQKAYASSTVEWAEALRARLETIAPRDWIPPWATRLLNAVIDTASVSRN